MNILYVTRIDPREASFGGQQRTHFIWKGLRSVGDVWTIVPVAHRDLEERDDVSRIYKVCFDKRYTLGWFAQRLYKRIFPFADCSWAYDQKLFKYFVERTVGRVDAVVSRYIHPAAALRLWEIAPLYVDADDIHTCEFEAETKLVGNSLKRRLLYWRLADFQFGVYKRAKKIWVPAPEQVALLSDYPLSWLPNIPSNRQLDVSKACPDVNRLMFVGLMSHAPNYLALDLFFRRYWGALKKEFPDLEFDVIGRGLPTQYCEDWAKYQGVNLRGFVADIRPYYEKSLAMVAPMLIGMGTCIKVLECLLVGRPLLSTSHGLRGIDVAKRTEGNGIFPIEDEASIRSAIRKLRDMPRREYQGICCAAVGFVESEYSQKVVNSILQNDLIREGAL